MTGQRIFPFLVNGQFWRKRAVDEKLICKGEVYIPIMKNLIGYNPGILPDAHCDITRLRFKLVESAQLKNGYIAHWFECFWVVDDNVYLENGRIYMKGK